jgi:hypothetical protein
MSDDGQIDFEGGGDEGYYDPDEIKSAKSSSYGSKADN